MKITEKKKTKDNTSLTLEGNFNIYTVEEIKDKLNKYLNGNSNLELDLSAVEKIDTPGFQLLLYIKNELSKNDKKLTITKPSEEVKTIFNTYREKI